MDAKLLWDRLKAKALISEFEIHTVPQNNSIPLWFTVGASGNHLVVKKSETNNPSIKITMNRMITFKDFEFVCRCYELWMKGDRNSRKEAQKKSQNTAYIYGLISESM